MGNTVGRYRCTPFFKSSAFDVWKTCRFLTLDDLVVADITEAVLHSVILSERHCGLQSYATTQVTRPFQLLSSKQKFLRR